MGFNCLKATATSRRQFTFYHSVPRKSWYSLYRPRKDERLSRPWSHPVALNTGPLDWESSALTTKPLLTLQLSLSRMVKRKCRHQQCNFSIPKQNFTPRFQVFFHVANNSFHVSLKLRKNGNFTPGNSILPIEILLPSKKVFYT